MSNGNVPAADLVAIEGLLLEKATAADYVAWRAAALKAGFIMRIAQRGGAYRDLATQKAMQADYDAGRYNEAPWFLSSPPSPRPANPGSSRHGFGRAVDIANAIGPGTFRDWVRATAAQFGFHLWTTADPNHFEHGDALTAAAVDEHPISQPTIPEATMPEALIKISDTSGKTFTKGQFLYHRDGFSPITLVDGDESKGEVYWLNTVCKVPIAEVGGATAETYQANQAKYVITGSGGSGATAAQMAAAVDAILADNFAALAKQEGTDQAALLAAIGQVDENTLATFGLKRI